MTMPDVRLVLDDAKLRRPGSPTWDITLPYTEKRSSVDALRSGSISEAELAEIGMVLLVRLDVRAGLYS